MAGFRLPLSEVGQKLYRNHKHWRGDVLSGTSNKRRSYPTDVSGEHDLYESANSPCLQPRTVRAYVALATHAGHRRPGATVGLDPGYRERASRSDPVDLIPAEFWVFGVQVTEAIVDRIRVGGPNQRDVRIEHGDIGGPLSGSSYSLS